MAEHDSNGGLPGKRLDLYKRLQAQVGRTPLYKLGYIPVPNGCTIYCKEEYRNPTGSHYDRETVRLLRGLEEEKKIAPGGRPLVETTTGSSGASFAWMCKALGFECMVWIPRDMPSARIEQIRSYGATVKFAPELEYIGGLVNTFQTWWSDRKNRRQYVFSNHSMDEEYSPEGMRDLARETLVDLEMLGQSAPAYFVTALGNGISARGVGEVLMERGTTLVGMEPRESPSVLSERFPDRFKAEYPAGWPAETHEIYGAGPGHDFGVKFPNIEAIRPHIDRIFLPRADDWRAVRDDLLYVEGKHVGNSSAACLWAALRLAEEVEYGSQILVIFYDAYWRYLPLRPPGSYSEAELVAGDG